MALGLGARPGLADATVDAGKTCGPAVNLGSFNCKSAAGVGLGRGTAGGRAGVNFSW